MHWQSSAWTFGGLFALLLVVGVAQMVHLFAVLQWTDRRTQGLNYYGQPRAGRRRFRRWLGVHAAVLAPLLHVLARTSGFRMRQGCFHFRGVAGPKGGACSEQTFEAAANYQPRPEDVFVATQMRCGTTWMQHLVLQVLSRGERDLAAEDVALNAVSPWLESNKTVAVETAPLIGRERPSRIIKTHLPATLCPLDPRARYVYVVRHPVSCFASCCDFVRGNLRGFPPETDELLEWFTSEELMWWGAWASHVEGWWQASRRGARVLWVRFEDMKQDLAATATRLADFLEVPPLDQSELDRIQRQCGFDHMRRQADVFEMHAPHLLQAPDRFFVSGRERRYLDVSLKHRQAVARWCLDALRDGEFPLAEFYPDLPALAAASD